MGHSGAKGDSCVSMSFSRPGDYYGGIVLRLATRQKEAIQINLSLMWLVRCVKAINENQTAKKAKQVPYKDNPLTFLLKSGLGGA